MYIVTEPHWKIEMLTSDYTHILAQEWCAPKMSDEMGTQFNHPNHRMMNPTVYRKIFESQPFYQKFRYYCVEIQQIIKPMLTDKMVLSQAKRLTKCLCVHFIQHTVRNMYYNYHTAVSMLLTTKPCSS